MDILKAVANAIRILHHPDEKLMAFEESIARRNKDLLENMRRNVKEMVLQRKGLGRKHLIYTDYFEFVTETDCHRVTNLPDKYEEIRSDKESHGK